MDAVEIDAASVAGDRVSFELAAPRRVRRFLNDDVFWAEYDFSLQDLPAALLVVPPTMSLAPLAWAEGLPVSVEAIDATFAESLPEVFEAYRAQYPSIFPPDLEPLTYDRAVEPSGETTAPSTADAAVLFSGGVDSLTAYAKRREKRPALVSIHGADLSIRHDEGWARVAASVRSLADAEGVPFHPVRSNFRSMLRYDFLDHAFMGDIGRDWWGAVHYGTALPALCAPIAHRHGYRWIYQGSGYTADPDFPEAQPSFVDRLRWGDTRVRITEVDRSRQEKIAYLADALDRLAAPVDIRSCYVDETGRNCSACEKCLRNVVALAVEGIDPGAVGYAADAATFARIRDGIESGQIALYGAPLRIWQEIQARARERDAPTVGDPDFFAWFRSVDLAAVATAEPAADGVDLNDRAKRFVYAMPFPLDAYLLAVGRRAKHALGA